MKCQILFSGKNKKNISKCRLLKILPRVLSVKLTGWWNCYCSALVMQSIYGYLQAGSNLQKYIHDDIGSNFNDIYILEQYNVGD